MDIKLNKSFVYIFIGVFASVLGYFPTIAQNSIGLKNDKTQLTWERNEYGFPLKVIDINGQSLNLKGATGEYTVLFSAEKPSKEPNWDQIDKKSANLPDKSYKLIVSR